MTRVLGFLVDGLRIVVTLALLSLVHLYRRLLSPWLPRSCRFQPTCSAYALQALVEQGPVRGCWKTLRRVARCHPWSEGGWDPP